ncbi:hypothetical protein GGI23_001215 [Coemansia sp. RSA 2559]|nr:hypothetical protein GGI23_001215 [Coemansia sp. RSA 2559]KAJ2866679.1 hypothetical protein GGI22_001228 [Coemansia erecta]
MPQKRRRPTSSSLSYPENDDIEQVLTLEDHTIEELEADDGNDRNDILLSLKNKEAEAKENEDDKTEVVGGESLDAGPARQISDFYTQEEAASLFRKPKKSKKSSATDKRRKRTEKKTSVNDLIDNERVNALMTRQTQVDDSNFADDDDDLQRAIARVRKASSMLKSAPLPEDIISQVAQSNNVESAAIEDESSSSDLVLSSTIEFVQNVRASVRNIKQSLVADSRRHRSVKEPPSSDAELPEADSKNIEQQEKSNEPELGLANQTNAEIAEFEAEPSVGSGLAATLSLLRQRNMLDNLSKEQKDRERLQRNRTAWLAEQRKREMLLQQERQRIKRLGRDMNNAPDTEATSADDGRGGSKRRGKADPMSQREIEELKAHEQELLDRKWAREYEEQMKDYKPDVKLEYYDDTGRKLTTKEAYKQLSHAFHGHYSGKNKIDRVMRKREKERKQMEMATSSTAHERGAALENIHRKHGTAGIVMSERNNGDLNHKGGSY